MSRSKDAGDRLKWDCPHGASNTLSLPSENSTLISKGMPGGVRKDPAPTRQSPIHVRSQAKGGRVGFPQNVYRLHYRPTSEGPCLATPERKCLVCDRPLSRGIADNPQFLNLRFGAPWPSTVKSRSPHRMTGAWMADPEAFLLRLRISACLTDSELINNLTHRRAEGCSTNVRLSTDPASLGLSVLEMD